MNDELKIIVSLLIRIIELIQQVPGVYDDDTELLDFAKRLLK